MKRNRFPSLIIAAALIILLTSSTTVLFIGDSITDGNWGNPVGYPCPTEKRSLTDLNHIYGHGYVFLVSSAYESDHPCADRHFINRGISGNTLADVESRWQSDVIAHHPDVLSILVGTNDVHYWLDGDKSQPFDYKGWEKRYRHLLDLTLDSLPGVKLVIGSPFTAAAGWAGTRDDFSEREAMIDSLAVITSRIAADYNAIYLPYDKMFRELQEIPGLPDGYWIWDGIHPTPAGHRRMADLWLNTVPLPSCPTFSNP